MLTQPDKLEKKLKARHITMIALGGSIGTGLFFSSGNAIYVAGPGGTLLSYLVIAIMVYFIMTSLAEMAAIIPVSGTFCQYVTSFVDPAWGFALSYIYWLSWAITLAVEISAASFIMGFWFPHVNFLIWSTIIFFGILIMNLFSVKVYGEAEYWLSLLKITAIFLFIIIGFLITFGVIGDTFYGFKNWTGPGVAFHGGAISLLAIFLTVSFSFQGTELFGVVAGETKDPKHSIPQATKSIFWRISICYIVSLFVISCIIPYNDPVLVHGGSDAATSPFTIVLAKAGIKDAANVMNAIILIAILSAANASLYSAARILWSTGTNRYGLKSFLKTNRHGTPIVTVILTALIGSLVFISKFAGTGNAFMWLLDLSSTTGLLAWLGIAVSHYQFRKIIKKRNYDLKKLPFISRWFPVSDIFSILLLVIIIILQPITLLFSHQHELWRDIISIYSGIVLAVLMWFIYRLINKTRYVDPAQCPIDFFEKFKEK